MVTVDSDGDVLNNYTYDVFAETRSETGAQVNEFQFAGQQVDGSTGLQYLRARYLDMETGRFISREPLMTSAEWDGNPFECGKSRPTFLVDPRGGYRAFKNCALDDACREDLTDLLGGRHLIAGTPLLRAIEKAIRPPGIGAVVLNQIWTAYSRTYDGQHPWLRSKADAWERRLYGWSP